MTLVFLAALFITVLAIVGAVQVAQWRFTTAAGRLGFRQVELDGSGLTTALPALLDGQPPGEFFVTAIYYGERAGQRFYFIRFGRDVAWWSRKKTAAFLRLHRRSAADGSYVGELLRHLRVLRPDVTVKISSGWALIISERISRKNLPQWLDSVAEMASATETLAD